MQDRIVTDYLDASAEKYPNKVAFSDENRNLTFKNLKNEAYLIAEKIIAHKLFKMPIVIFLDKSVECLSAFMGVAYSGNFYTPIDTSMPIDRIKKILETLNPALIITDRSHGDQVLSFSSGVPVIFYEECLNLDGNSSIVDERKEKIIDTDVLYVLFTSGSTGTPKGVIIPHKGVIDYIDWFSSEFSIMETDKLGNQAPLYFDLSIQDVYLPLKTGCSVHLFSTSDFSFPAKLMENLIEKRINIIVWVPSALVLVANLKGLKVSRLPDLKYVLFCGEVMPNKQLNKWRSAFTTTTFVNMYGPTEAVDACSYYIVKRNFEDSDSLPIGIPCKNTNIIVLDENNNAITENRIGELCIRGSSLAYGYYNNPEKTKEAFVQNPLNSSYPELIYRTGDLVKYNEYGELLYVSRKDFQIKHMGNRIELGEIETAVSSLSKIEASCCLYDEKRKKIVLFYTGSIKDADITEKLKELLPDYMIPNKRVHMDSMPYNLNGKIDRVVLKKYL